MIIPAGGTLKGPLADRFNVPHKALLAPQGVRLIDVAVNSALACSGTRRVCVPADIPFSLDDRVILTEGGTSAPNTILSGVNKLHPVSQHFLIITADLPFLTTEMIEHFVQHAPDADFVAAVFDRNQFQSKFPNTTSTYVKLNDGEWTMGGLFLARSAAFVPSLKHMEAAFQNRKSVIGMVKLLGWRFLLDFALRRINVTQTVSKIESILGCSIALVRDADPALAYDIDDLDDYEYAERYRPHA